MAVPPINKVILLGGSGGGGGGDATLAGTQTFTGEKTFTQPVTGTFAGVGGNIKNAFHAESGLPGYSLKNTDAPANTGVYSIRVNDSGQMVFFAVADDGNTGTEFLVVYRSNGTNTVTDIGITGNFGVPGNLVQGGGRVLTPSAMGALAVNTAKQLNTKSISADSTLTFSGAPTADGAWFGLLLTNTDASPHVVTLPANVVSVSRGGTLAAVTIAASSSLFLQWCYFSTGPVYYIFGDGPVTSGAGGAFVLTEGGNLGQCTIDGTNLAGFRGAPQNAQSAAYTTVLADAGKCIFHPVGDNNARTFTIDSNTNVPYPIGTIIAFTNMAAASATIAITSDTLTFLPAGSTGSRTLAQYGKAFAEKITTTGWTISGNSALT